MQEASGGDLGSVARSDVEMTSAASVIEGKDQMVNDRVALQANHHLIADSREQQRVISSTEKQEAADYDHRYKNSSATKKQLFSSSHQQQQCASLDDSFTSSPTAKPPFSGPGGAEHQNVWLLSQKEKSESHAAKSGATKMKKKRKRDR